MENLLLSDDVQISNAVNGSYWRKKADALSRNGYLYFCTAFLLRVFQQFIRATAQNKGIKFPKSPMDTYHSLFVLYNKKLHG